MKRKTLRIRRGPLALAPLCVVALVGCAQVTPAEIEVAAKGPVTPLQDVTTYFNDSFRCMDDLLGDYEAYGLVIYPKGIQDETRSQGLAGGALDWRAGALRSARGWGSRISS